MISFEDYAEKHKEVPMFEIDEPEELTKQQEADLRWLEESMWTSPTKNTRK